MNNVMDSSLYEYPSNYCDHENLLLDSHSSGSALSSFVSGAPYSGLASPASINHHSGQTFAAFKDKYGPKPTQTRQGSSVSSVSCSRRSSVLDTAQKISLERYMPTTLASSRDFSMERQAKAHLYMIVDAYILKHCSKTCLPKDFDMAVRDGLSKLTMLQALHCIEHFATSVSPKVHNRSAYLMGIIKAQSTFWSNSKAAEMLPGGVKQLLDIPSQLELLIGTCCIQGFMLPSDVNPEVCIALHALPLALAAKAVAAFNSNKRIGAGVAGGVVNRTRFFLRLIRNVADQNPVSPRSMQQGSYQAPAGNRVEHFVRKDLGRLNYIEQEIEMKKAEHARLLQGLEKLVYEKEHLGCTMMRTDHGGYACGVANPYASLLD